MKRILVPTVLAAAAVALAGAAAAHAPGAQLTIRHQLHGCHAWALNGGSYRVSQVVRLHRGANLTITNGDVMAHTLVKLSGPAVRMQNVVSSMQMGPRGPFAPGTMGNMQSGVRVAFTRPGTYRFATKAGEDFMQGMKTIGKDNVLKLTVRVS